MTSSFSEARSITQQLIVRGESAHLSLPQLRGEDGGLGGHHGWAECSLVMSENVLVEKMGLKPPAWIDAAVYHEYVRYNKTKAAKLGGWAQG